MRVSRFKVIFAVLLVLISANILIAPRDANASVFACNGRVIRAGADYKNYDLSGCDFSNRNLIGINLHGSWLNNVNFDGADLSDSDLTNTSLRYSSFVGTKLSGTRLAGASLRGVSSSHVIGQPATLPRDVAIIKGTIFSRYATVSNINLGSADLRSVDLSGIISSRISGNPILASGWCLRSGFLVGPNANLRGASISNVNLTNCDLSNGALRGLYTIGVTGSPILPKGSRIVAGHVVGPMADLTGVDFTGQDLSGLDLSHAILNSAILRNVNLKDARLDGGCFSWLGCLNDLVSGGITNAPSGTFGTSNIWGPVTFVNGFLVGSGVNLSGSNLRGSDLTPLGWLSNVNFQGSDLRNAKLFAVRSNFNGSNLTGASITTTWSTFESAVCPNGALYSQGGNCS